MQPVSLAGDVDVSATGRVKFESTTPLLDPVDVDVHQVRAGFKALQSRLEYVFPEFVPGTSGDLAVEFMTMQLNVTPEVSLRPGQLTAHAYVEAKVKHPVSASLDTTVRVRLYPGTGVKIDKTTGNQTQTVVVPCNIVWYGTYAVNISLVWAETSKNIDVTVQDVALNQLLVNHSFPARLEKPLMPRLFAGTQDAGAAFRNDEIRSLH
jgi:hypothetical protein